MVDLRKLEFFICKLAISVVVVILNYIFSKLLIFRKDPNSGQEKKTTGKQNSEYIFPYGTKQYPQ